MATNRHRNVQLDGWLLARLDNLRHQGVRYESSWYGPINGLLHTYFPISDHYLVKPQARLRTAAEAGEARTSIDSYGLQVEVQNDDDFPDFLVAKARASLHDDIPFMIVEAKRNAIRRTDGVFQSDRYLYWAMEYLRRSPGVTDMPGFMIILMLGPGCEVYRIDKDRKFVLTSFDGPITSFMMHNLMLEWIEFWARRPPTGSL